MSTLKLKIKKTILKRKVDGATLTGYYGRVISNGKIAFLDVARESTRNTTVHPSEAETAAKLLLEGVCDRLKQGYIVDLGPLGTLYPAVNGAWKQDSEDLKLSEMTPKVNYKPSDDIAGSVRAASLAWAGEAATEGEPTEGGEDVVDDDSDELPGG